MITVHAGEFEYGIVAQKYFLTALDCAGARAASRYRLPHTACSGGLS